MRHQKETAASLHCGGTCCFFPPTTQRRIPSDRRPKPAGGKDTGRDAGPEQRRIRAQTHDLPIARGIVDGPVWHCSTVWISRTGKVSPEVLHLARKACSPPASTPLPGASPGCRRHTRSRQSGKPRQRRDGSDLLARAAQINTGRPASSPVLTCASNHAQVE